MSNKWKGRVIRGGGVVVCAMGLIGAMVGLTGIMAGYPGVVRASVIILTVAACIGAASVIVVTVPGRSRTRRRRCRRGQNRPWRRRGTRRVVCREEYREGANHQRPSRAHRIPLGPLGNGRRQLWS